MVKKVLGVLVGYVLLAVIVIPLLVTAIFGGFRTEAVTEAKISLDRRTTCKSYALSIQNWRNMCKGWCRRKCLPSFPWKP